MIFVQFGMYERPFPDGMTIREIRQALVTEYQAHGGIAAYSWYGQAAEAEAWNYRTKLQDEDIPEPRSYVEFVHPRHLEALQARLAEAPELEDN